MDLNNKKTLIKSLLSNRLTVKRRKDFAELISVDKEIKKQWHESGKRIGDERIKEQIWKKVISRCNHKKKYKVLAELKSFSIAASLALFIAIGGYWLSSKGDKKKENFVKITAQESTMHVLPDSSKVWMEPGSSIKYVKSFINNRKVWLEGNSLFEVSKRESSTFQVYINKAYVEVKGTCFLIKQNSSDHNEITLINGSIDLNIENGNKRIPMKPKQRVIYKPQLGETEIKEIADIKWEDGKFHLNDMSLAKLIQTINQLYNTNIILKKDVNRESAFTGTIRYDEPLTNVLNKVCFSLNLSKEQTGNQIIIY